MTARHWGIPNVTARSTSGGIGQSSGPHNSAYTTRADTNVIQLATALPPDADRLNSGGFGRQLFIENDQPVIEPYELGSGLLFLFVMLLPAAIVCGLVLGYLLFVAQPI